MTSTGTLTPIRLESEDSALYLWKTAWARREHVHLLLFDGITVRRVYYS
jgi:hypothetical protein